MDHATYGLFEPVVHFERNNWKNCEHFRAKSLKFHGGSSKKGIFMDGDAAWSTEIQ
jgi:hypothetical protein